MYYRETGHIETTVNGAYDISSEIIEIIHRSGIKNGYALIEIPHSTAGIMTTTGHCPPVKDDLFEELDRLVPARIDWQHEENPFDAAGHIKCALFGTSVSAIVENGELLSWDRIYYFLTEYDAPRPRKFHVAVMGE